MVVVKLAVLMVCFMLGAGAVGAAAMSPPAFAAPECDHAIPARGVSIGDVNGDGWPDVVANANDSVFVFQNDRAGHVSRFGSYRASGPCSDVAVGDFDKDGLDDWAVAVATGTVDVWLEDTGGRTRTSVAISGALNTIDVSDVDGDGFKDLVITAGNYRGNGKLEILWNDGAGGFNASSAYVYPTSAAVAYDAAVTDLDNDGRRDLVVVSPNFGALMVFKNLGSRQFAEHNVFTPGQYGAVVATDWDLDGFVDVLAAKDGTGLVSFFHGLGNGSFAAPFDIAVAAQVYSMCLGYFTSDTRIGLATANYATGSVSIVANDGYGGFEAAVSFPAGDEVFDLATADLDRNFSSDIIVASYGTSGMCVFRNARPGPAAGIESPQASPSPHVWVTVKNSDCIIMASGFSGVPVVSAFDLAGRVVATVRAPAEQLEGGIRIPLGLLPGMYFVRVSSGRAQAWAKTIVLR